MVPEGNPLGIEKVEDIVKKSERILLTAKKEQEQEWIGGYEVVATDIPKQV
jgi:hypothetical protein